MRRFLPDQFTLILIATVAFASFFPAVGKGASFMLVASNLAISLLFFLHGARLSTDAIVAGVKDVRLHALILGCTFILFPALGLALRAAFPGLLTPALWLGVIFVCTLSSTVQSSIAFTSMARGNVPAAVCSASASSLLGIFLTPLLVGTVVANAGSAPISFDAVGKIMLQLLLPFVLGQFARRWIGAWVHKRKAMLKFVDQGSILLVVYTAFSEAINEGLWSTTPIPALLGLVVCCAVILALALGLSALAGRMFGFNLPDRITLLFCGSKKSLASGIPMAQVLFAGHAVGAIVLPLMLFHQIQLMVCGVLAARYGKRPETEE